ncbi:TPA: hypothetical protein QDZ66_001769 [Pluralibacter gergoviae]|uniref:Uncharacterized protein n=1 Tax=Pluralibacter gergoviae TaxID=61647 RepID=A0A0J5LDS2_PLUGE|nr:hypothetical protein [Pluralibacter gergoviae]KMK16544.1 hypothetical protein ABW06_00960 [Pluralibacter gergoviae]KMK27078.1 hypothetical protein ABW10_00960 [Pluralibacter gergoviae]MBL3691254.1 hypothetical protein [Pluralibacter gergoviae]HDS1151020.1 hypothetical protein [Pluralibacter gergoviae]
MQLMKIALIAAALAAAAGSAVAEDSVDIKVIGHIVPAGCTPSVSDARSLTMARSLPARLSTGLTTIPSWRRKI